MTDESLKYSTRVPVEIRDKINAEIPRDVKWIVKRRIQIHLLAEYGYGSRRKR